MEPEYEWSGRTAERCSLLSYSGSVNVYGKLKGKTRPAAIAFIGRRHETRSSGSIAYQT